MRAGDTGKAKQDPNVELYRGRILLVDDEEGLRRTFERFLQRAGYLAVSAVSDYDQAAVLIRQHQFQLIITDIVLEGATGLDVLRLVGQQQWACPVVMITGYPNIDTAAEAVRLGAYDYLPKPVTKETLLAVTKKAIGWTITQQRQQEERRRRAVACARQQTRLSSLPVLVMTVGADGGVVALNEQARTWARSCCPELRPSVQLPALDHPVARACWQTVRRVVREKKAVAEHLLEWSRDGNNAGVLRLSGAPMLDSGGTIRGVVLSAWDADKSRSEILPAHISSFHGLIGSSAVMQQLYTVICQAGPCTSTVLISGPSGTGKDLVAHALHAESPRAQRPFIKVDCASIPEELLASELFGHRKGAFTGATSDRLGRILQADGGTLFLDEIGEISTTTQVRLLRFLQEREFYPVGHDQPITVDVRVIAATNADLPAMVANGRFRQDLYYRLRVVDITLPSLRQRGDDIVQLVEHFRSYFCRKLGRPEPEVTEEFMACLRGYHWPGNVRELRHVMERCCVLCTNRRMTPELLPREVVCGAQSHNAVGPPAEADCSEFIGDSRGEAGRIIAALRKTAGNKSKAARLLGMDRSTIYRKIMYHQIKADDYQSDFILENPSEGARQNGERFDLQ